MSAAGGPVDPEGALALQQSSLAHWLRWLGQASPGARLVELPGVTAAVVPAVPGRSIANGVSFRSAGDLERAYDELADAYADAGVSAWTVWTPDTDADALALLADKGHAFDGAPAAMTAELASVELPSPAELAEDGFEWDHEITPEELGELNDRAYEYDEGAGVAAAYGSAPKEMGFHWYRAVVDGETVSGLAIADCRGDAGVYFVATRPDRQRRGLGRRLLAVALAEARERGRVTSTLQASSMGEPVYAALGYRKHFALHMYERRTTPRTGKDIP